MFIEEGAPIAGGTLGPRAQPGGIVNDKGELVHRQMDPLSSKMKGMVSQKQLVLDSFIRNEKKKKKRRA